MVSERSRTAAIFALLLTLVGLGVTITTVAVQASTVALAVEEPMHSVRGQTSSVGIVGQLGGASYAVAVRGDYAYVGVGPRIAVLDISEPTTPTLITKTSFFPGVVSDVVLTGTHLYVAAKEGGLRILDVSDPADPVEVSSYQTVGFARGVAVAGDPSDGSGEVYAYVSVVGTYSDSEHGLHIIQVSDPLNPTELSFHSTPGEAANILVARDSVGGTGQTHAFITIGGQGICIVDVSDPSAPVQLSLYDTPGYARGIALLTDPSRGSAGASQRATQVHAIIADGVPGMLVLDVSDPSAPYEVSSHDMPGYARDVKLSGNLAFVANGLDGLWVVDVADPANPFDVGFHDPPEYASGVFLADGAAYLPDGYGGLLIVDVSDPAAPTALGSYDAPGVARAVSVSGQYAYVMDRDTGLRVVDVADPARPTGVGFLATPGAATGVAISGTYAFVADGNRGLRVVDVRDPTRLVAVGVYDTPGSATAVVVAGHHAYVADGGEGLRIVDVADPSAPFEAGSYDTPGTARGVKVVRGTLTTAGSTVGGTDPVYAYVADDDGGLRIVDVSDPVSPFELGFFQTPDHQTYDVEVPGAYYAGSGQAPAESLGRVYAYVADEEPDLLKGNLRIVDVTDPAAPAQVGFYRSERPLRGIALAGDHAYVIDNRGGFLTMDISDPTSPFLEEYYEAMGDSWELSVLGNYVYLASGAGGLVILQRSGPEQGAEVDLGTVSPRFVGEEEGDWAAYSVSPAGDVNGDGYADALVGAPMAGNKEPGVPTSGEGKTYLILGRPQYLWATEPITLSHADASFLGCGGYAMSGRQNYTAGDVNGDGYDDFLITGWKCGPEYEGKAYLFLGKPEPDWGLDFPVEEADASFLGEHEQDRAGYYLSTAGDVNGDGYDDFTITSPYNSEIGERSGKVYLILGRASADWGQEYPLSLSDASFLAEAEDDRAGRSSAAAGDVNGDGYDDFLIGAIFNDEAGTDAGQSYLILGRQVADWGRDVPLSLADASFLGEAAGDETGRRIAGGGDVNGDGLADFLVGASRQDEVGLDAGKAYLILGRSEADWGMDFSLALADAAFLGEHERDQAGRRVSSAGDFDGDGYDDFLIGAPHNSRGGEGAGTAYLILGRPAADWGDGFPLSQADVAYIGEPDVGVAGYDVAPAGDMDGDGMDDFLIGAYGGRQQWDIPGTAYVVLSQVDVAPGMPVLLSPVDGTLAFTHSVSFVWEAGAGGDPEAFNLELDGTIITTTETSSATVLATGIHSWRVRAFNDAGYSGFSDAWTLTVEEPKRYIYLPLVARSD